jgi:Na+-transporting NADH:ubiquinone oxidoreductase subunit NqrF
METKPLKINNRVIEQGTELSIIGETGRFKFMYVFDRDHSITVYGGKNGHAMFRSFMPNQVSRVHTKKKLR